LSYGYHPVNFISVALPPVGIVKILFVLVPDDFGYLISLSLLCQLTVKVCRK